MSSCMLDGSMMVRCYSHGFVSLQSRVNSQRHWSTDDISEQVLCDPSRALSYPQGRR